MGANIELIVIDGGSTDGFQSVVDSYEETINRLVSEPDKGIYDAMNKGLDLATGDSVQFLNSGDRYFKGFNVAKFQQRQPLAEKVVTCRTIQVFKDDAFIRPSFRIGLGDLESMGHPGVFAPRCAYENVRYNVDFTISADRLWKQQLSELVDCVYCPEICSIFELGGLSNSPSCKQVIQFCKQPIALRRKLFTIAKLPVRYILGQKRTYRFLLSRKCDLVPTDFIAQLESCFEND